MQDNLPVQKSEPVDTAGFRAIKRGVSEGVYDGKEVVAKETFLPWLPLYSLWPRTKALPVVYSAFRKADDPLGMVVVMEKLLPFVYDAAREPEYYAAIKEVYEVSGYMRPRLSPSSIMMRADGQIVFIDTWGLNSSEAIGGEQKEAVLGEICRSLKCILFFVTHIDAIAEKCKQAAAEIKAVFPTKRNFSRLTGYMDSFYNALDRQIAADEESAEFVLLISNARCRARMIDSWFKKAGRTVDEFEPLAGGRTNMPEFDAFYESEIAERRASVADVFKELGMASD